MKCGFCAKEIPEENEKKGCSGCPMSGGCRKVCCPFCGYENPAIPNYLKRWSKSGDPKGED